MAESILKIHTQNGDIPVGYPGLADKPISDKTLSKEGAFADSKAVGDKFAKVDSETASLREDIADLESELIETVYGKNLLDISKCTANSYINSDTGIIEHDDRRKGYVTDLIPVKE